ncbi:hypothetical protein SNE40_001026 [Patella caerulea]|uniref:Uncharacterized protein n=1 Tax=Patella caerulea TaxID=87958 RepID=A0AAN8QAQ5_PATCE
MELVYRCCVLLFIFVTCIDMVNGQITIQNIRLANGNDSYGRVEVQIGGAYGTVCDDQWDDLDASVICRSLGFPDGGSGVQKARFGQGTGTIFLDDVACEGDEVKLEDCKMNPQIGGHDCDHGEDAGVICNANTGVVPAPSTTTRRPVGPQPDNCASQNGQVRLIAPNGTVGIGLVEIFYNNSWGSICDDRWDQLDARVVCAMLCYDTTFARPGALEEILKYVQPQSGIIVDNVDCVGTEPRVQDCPHSQWYVHNCGPLELASVTCVDLDSKAPDPPVPTLQCKDGYLISLFSRSRDRNLEEKHLSVTNPTSSCNIIKSTDDNFVIVRIPFTGCGTTVTQNSTHLIYSNVIKYDYTNLDVNKVRVNTFLVSVFCEMPRNVEADRNLEPLTQAVSKKAEGRFVINMTFYQNNSFTNPVSQYPVRMPLGEWLNVALQLESIDERLKLIVPDCVATPSINRSDPINYPLFEKNCPNEPTLGFFPLSQIKFGYRYQPFMFVNNPLVFLHCGAFVCLVEEETAECDRSCNTTKPDATARRKRDVTATTRTKYYIDSGPMMVYKAPGVPTAIERIDTPTSYATTITVPLSTEIQQKLAQRSTTPKPTPQPTTYGATVKVRSTQDNGKPEIVATTHEIKEAEKSTEKISTTQASRPDSVSEMPTTPYSKIENEAVTLKPTEKPLEGIWIEFPKRPAAHEGNTNNQQEQSAGVDRNILIGGVNGASSVNLKSSLVTLVLFFLFFYHL